MVERKQCNHCGQVHDFTHHGPNCLPAWIYLSQHKVPPHANQHTATALVGPRGAGKTGGGLCIAKLLQVTPFDVNEQVYFAPADRIHVARRLGKGMVVYGDESTGEGGHKRRAMSGANVDNAMDLDIMRGRNQHSIFTAPDFSDLDGAIQRVCDWIHVFNHDHTVKTYEVTHSGKPGNEFHNKTLRFTTENFPHAEIEYPDLWAAWQTKKDDYLAGRNTKNQAKNRAFEEKAKRIMLSLLQSSKMISE